MLKGGILYDQLAWERMYFTLSKAFHSLLFSTLKNKFPLTLNLNIYPVSKKQ